MTHPENALVLNGVVIAILEPETALYLQKMADEGKRPGMQYRELQIPLHRDDFSVVREDVGVDLYYKTTVQKTEANLSILFTRKSEPQLVRE